MIGRPKKTEEELKKILDEAKSYILANSSTKGLVVTGYSEDTLMRFLRDKQEEFADITFKRRDIA